MSFIQFGEKSTQRAGKWIVSYTNHLLDCESMVLKELSQSLHGENSYVNFALACMPHTMLGVKRVSQDHFVAYMGSERLFPQEQRKDVMEAGQVGSGDYSIPTRL